MSSGWIHVISGPMFSGKTEMLLRLVRRYQRAGKNPLLFRPSIDTRTDTVVSRSGLSFPANAISTTAEYDEIFFDVIKNARASVIAFDEAQFFDSHFINLELLADELAFNGIRVLIAGLDRDFLTRPFGQMGNLLVQADEVTKLSAVCTICHEDATLTQRLIDGRPASRNDPLIVVGGMIDDTYEARCRLHHQIG